MTKLTFPWADKYREIVKEESSHGSDEEYMYVILSRFEKYIKEEEKKFNERWEDDNKKRV